MLETILAITTVLFGGLNIFQFIFIKDTKKRYHAETLKAEQEARHESVNLAQDQYDYVNTQLSKIQTEYYELAAKYRETMTAHLQEIDVKCNEIAELKSKLIYFKGLRCYRSDCGIRISKKPYDKGEESERSETQTNNE